MGVSFYEMVERICRNGDIEDIKNVVIMLAREVDLLWERVNMISDRIDRLGGET